MHSAIGLSSGHLCSQAAFGNQLKVIPLDAVIVSRRLGRHVGSAQLANDTTQATSRLISLSTQQADVRKGVDF
ncbi:hypothetical protein L3Q67_01375 [Saccharothrix sp. AJ9571]|nr:hypothetical protein L3Q67_01375 [Saccharothrix sp. AJ9571]